MVSRVLLRSSLKGAELVVHGGEGRPWINAAQLGPDGEWITQPGDE